MNNKPPGEGKPKVIDFEQAAAQLRAKQQTKAGQPDAEQPSSEHPAVVLLRRADSEEQAGQLLAAEVSYRQLLELNPEDPGAWQYLGELLYKQKRFAEAETCFNEVLKFNGANAALWQHLGLVYHFTHRREQAHEAYEKALKLDPSLTYTYYNLAIIEDELNNPFQALKNFNEFLKRVTTETSNPDGKTIMYAETRVKELKADIRKW